MPPTSGRLIAGESAYVFANPSLPTRRTVMSAVTPDFVLGYRAMMVDGFGREVEITKRVLAAVPDGKRDYRPDPNARTAWELAWHIANTDTQFLDGIADQKYTMSNPAEADKPKTVA